MVTLYLIIFYIDHRLYYFDILNTIFNISIKNLQPVTRRGVNSANKIFLRNYCTDLYTKCTEHKLFNKYKKF